MLAVSYISIVGVMKYSFYVRLQTDFGKLREVGPLKALDLVSGGAPDHYPVCPRFAKEFKRAAKDSTKVGNRTAKILDLDLVYTDPKNQPIRLGRYWFIDWWESGEPK